MLLNPIIAVRPFLRKRQRGPDAAGSDVLPAAKRYARSRGVSLSSLIEQSLIEMTGDDKLSFMARWCGQLEAARGGDPRYEALARKYL